MGKVIKIIKYRWVAVGYIIGMYLLAPTYVLGQTATVAFQIARMLDRFGIPF